MMIIIRPSTDPSKAGLIQMEFLFLLQHRLHLPRSQHHLQRLQHQLHCFHNKVKPQGRLQKQEEAAASWFRPLLNHLWMTSSSDHQTSHPQSNTAHRTTS